MLSRCQHQAPSELDVCSWRPIVAPDSSVSYAIVGAGGFVGLRRHHVAIPVTQLSQRDGEFLLPGATKAAIKAMPTFDYAD